MKKETVLLVDDLDGGHAEETLEFGLDNVSYEIDLSTDNAGKLRDFLADYVAGARKANTPATRSATRKANAADTTAQRDKAKLVRLWAADQTPPIVVNARGRIPAEVMAAYDAVHNGGAQRNGDTDGSANKPPHAEQAAAGGHTEHTEHTEHAHHGHHSAEPHNGQHSGVSVPVPAFSA